ncbi:MAG: YqaA family protein, partial [Alphaproteobacteria bacterium]|nr:YqaA family protein [Alphaproteobacteria bacterium]
MEATGYVSLFVVAFTAATILPLSSEAVLSALVASDGFRISLIIAIASLGNTIGACVNWALGRYCLRWHEKRWFPISTAGLECGTKWFCRYGLFALLFSWVPIVGDVLTVVAGIFRVRFFWFLLLVAAGKTARYIVVAAISEKA